MANSNMEPPLVDVKVTNPVIYLRRWWQKVIGNEGVSFSVKIHPLTAIAMGVAIFGIGRYSINIPFLNYQTFPTPSPTSVAEILWKETAFTGKLQYSATSQKYFLITTSSEAITLDVPRNLDLLTLVGKRIMAVGEYNKSLKLLRVSDVKDLEVLPNSPIPIPTIEPSISPTVVPTITTSATPTVADTMENNE